VLPAEILKKVKLLELNTRKLVNNMFAGEYHTVFKGQGMTFSEFREYVPGDDVRAISWALTARAGKPYIKKFDEEREMTLLLVVDVSGSSDFGSTEYFKGEVMTHLSALLAFSATKNKDQVGLVLFSDQVEHYVPPKRGSGQVHRILRDLYYHKPKSRRTSIASVLSYISGIQKKRAVIFVFSDFMDQNFDSQLRLLGRKHDVVACVVNDPAEINLPNVGLCELQDAETGEIMTVDTSSTEFQQNWRKLSNARKENRDRLLRQSQVDRIDVDTKSDFVQPLIQFFQKRKAR
jgi:uncharacterized protein (DUF58 family)